MASALEFFGHRLVRSIALLTCALGVSVPRRDCCGQVERFTQALDEVHAKRASARDRVDQGNTEHEVDHYVTTAMRRQHIPGLSLAVVRAGKVVKSRGYGQASIELGVPASDETV